MTTATVGSPTSDTTPATGPGVAVPADAATVVAIKRRTIDSILIGFGVVATAAFGVAGGLLTWGNDFSSDYVHKELSSQHISFPAAEALTKEGRTDLLEWAGRSVDTGDEAQAYASFIDGHLNKVADGATYADLGTPQRAAAAAVTAATEANQPQSEIDALQAEVTAITAQRNTLFTGETLRGLLLSAYAWSTVGWIAGVAAIVAFAAAAVMGILVVLGVVHHRKVVASS